MKTLALLTLLATAAFAQSRDVVLTWTPGPGNPTNTQYNVERAASCAATAAWAKINPALITGLTYTDSNVTIGSSYCYRARAVVVHPTAGQLVSDPSPTTQALITPNAPGSITITINIAVTP